MTRQMTCQMPRRTAATPPRWPLLAPSVLVLGLWAVVPLAMTLWYSTRYYNLLQPDRRLFVGLANYRYLVADPATANALLNSLVLIGSVLIISPLAGLALALLFNREFPGRAVARVLVISPFS